MKLQSLLKKPGFFEDSSTILSVPFSDIYFYIYERIDLSLMKKILLKLLMGASLTASVFLFQACYGCPPDIVEMPRNQTQTLLPEEDMDNPESTEAQELEDDPAITEED